MLCQIFMEPLMSSHLLMPSSIGSLVCNPPVFRRVYNWNWLVVHHLGFGFPEAPIATSLCLNLVSLVSIVYAYFFVSRKAWAPLGSGVQDGWGVLARLGVAGIGESIEFHPNSNEHSFPFYHCCTGQIASEWWSWELVGCRWYFVYSVTRPTELFRNL